MYAVQGDTACRLPRLHPSFEAHATYGRELPVFICRPAFPCWPAGVIAIPGAISLAATRFGTKVPCLESHRARRMRLARLIALGALALGVASAPAITQDLGLDLNRALEHDQHSGHSSSCYHSDTSKGVVVLTKCRRTTTHRSKTRSSSSTSCPRATTTTAPPNSTTTGPATTTTTASVDMCDKGVRAPPPLPVPPPGANRLSCKESGR